jgi:folate-binding protein YgfZ
MESVTPRLARRPRSYVAVRGADAEDLLQRMLSNDVSGEWCEALLLTPKARVIAPLTVWRRGPDDFLLLTEPELGSLVRDQLLRMRFRSRCEIELEEHTSTIELGVVAGGIPNRDYGMPAVERLDDPREPTVGAEELEALRIVARTPRFGRELDDRALPAEAGLTERAVSFTKGCYPGQEPVARLRYRGHANRSLRVLELDGDPPEHGAEVAYEGKVVGRVTSAARRPDGSVVALAYVRVEVPEDAELAVGRSTARPLDFASARP